MTPPANITTKIKDQLRIEQWTAKSINEVTINDFKGLDAVIDEIDSEQNIEEILGILEQQLQQAPKNISALYGASIIKLKNKSIDDSQLINLLDLFHDHKRWGLWSICAPPFCATETIAIFCVHWQIATTRPKRMKSRSIYGKSWSRSILTKRIWCSIWRRSIPTAVKIGRQSNSIRN